VEVSAVPVSGVSVTPASALVDDETLSASFLVRIDEPGEVALFALADVVEPVSSDPVIVTVHACTEGGDAGG
jgi:hypothetical protein